MVEIFRDESPERSRSSGAEGFSLGGMRAKCSMLNPMEGWAVLQSRIRKRRFGPRAR